MPASRQFGFIDAWNNRNFAATRGKDEFNHSRSLSDTKNPSGYQDRTAVPRIRREQCDACRIRGHEVRFCVMLVNTGIYRLAFCQCDKSRLYGPCSLCINLGLLCSQSLMDGRGVSPLSHQYMAFQLTRALPMIKPGDDVNLGQSSKAGPVVAPYLGGYSSTAAGPLSR